jgi:hypothetical protein
MTSLKSEGAGNLKIVISSWRLIYHTWFCKWSPNSKSASSLIHYWAIRTFPLHNDPKKRPCREQCTTKIVIIIDGQEVSITRICVRDKEGHISQMVESLNQPPEFFIFASVLPRHRESAELCIKLEQIIIIIFAYFFPLLFFISCLPHSVHNLTYSPIPVGTARSHPVPITTLAHHPCPVLSLSLSPVLIHSTPPCHAATLRRLLNHEDKSTAILEMANLI